MSQFILELIKYIKAQINIATHFIIHQLDLMLIQPPQNTGDIMPVEFLNSSLIPFKLENKSNSNETILFIGTLEKFEKDTFIRLMGLAKRFYLPI